jgi:hypothetical protein
MKRNSSDFSPQELIKIFLTSTLIKFFDLRVNLSVIYRKRKKIYSMFGFKI